MSLHHDTTPQNTVIRLSAGGFSFALRQIIHQVSEGHHARKIAETRKATRREIANLPTSLQQDLAFSDGTVIALVER